MLAWSLTGLALAMLAAALVLLGLNVSRPNASRLDAALIGFYGLLAVGALTCAGADGLIARRVRGNAIGWLLSLAGLCLTVDMLTEQYALYGLATNPGAIPAAKVAGVLSDAAVGLTVILLFALVLLFPDGRLPSPRWRPALWALAVVAVGLVAQRFQAGQVEHGGVVGQDGSGVGGEQDGVQFEGEPGGVLGGGELPIDRPSSPSVAASEAAARRIAARVRSPSARGRRGARRRWRVLASVMLTS